MYTLRKARTSATDFVTCPEFCHVSWLQQEQLPSSRSNFFIKIKNSHLMLHIPPVHQQCSLTALLSASVAFGKPAVVLMLDLRDTEITLALDPAYFLCRLRRSSTAFWCRSLLATWHCLQISRKTYVWSANSMRSIGGNNWTGKELSLWTHCKICLHCWYQVVPPPSKKHGRPAARNVIAPHPTPTPHTSNMATCMRVPRNVITPHPTPNPKPKKTPKKEENVRFVASRWSKFTKKRSRCDGRHVIKQK